MPEEKTEYITKRDHLFCLVGPSGSGKTAVAKALHDKGYNVLQSYTTRPPRTPDEWGHTFREDLYKIADVRSIKNILKSCIESKTIIAYTYYNGHYYWAAQNQLKGPTIYVIDPAGVESIIQNDTWPRDQMTIICLQATFDNRYSRMALQGRPAREIRERLDHDEEAFKVVRADWLIDANRPLEEVVELVEGII